MRDSKLVGGSALALLILAVAVLLLGVLFSGIFSQGGISPEVAMWAAGGLAIMATVLGLIAFRTPAGKVAAIGGFLLLMLILLVTPVSFRLT